MQVNKFMTLAVGLVVGVLLIAGVVAPVIANVSSDSEDSNTSDTDSNVERTNIGEKYTLANANTNMTLYPAGSGKISTQPETVADRTVYDAPEVNIFYRTGSLNDLTRIYPSSSEEKGNYFTESSYNYSKLSFEGTTLKAETLEGDVITFEDVACFTNPIGDYVNTFIEEYDAPYSPPFRIQSAYASSDSPLYILVQQNGYYMRSWILMITGTPSSPVATLFDTDSAHDEFALTSDVRISLVENEITEISFAVNDTSYTLGPDNWFDGYDFGIYYAMVLPEHVGGEEGGSGGISDTLKATLTVIPLVMTVGLILGAITFLRMKN
ncbi:MAG: hypothetical protein IIY21_18290 [Clostridiales bacterium]|nr:hypothetical protein [Clostridiales bacterium]